MEVFLELPASNAELPCEQPFVGKRDNKFFLGIESFYYGSTTIFWLIASIRPLLFIFILLTDKSVSSSPQNCPASRSRRTQLKDCLS